MGKLAFVLLVTLAACGDDIKPQLTWGEAEEIWADSWCAFAARCSPPTYESVGGDAGCVQYVLDLNCDFDCSEKYPSEREPLLEQCRLEMETIDCGARKAPASCYSAYFRP